MLNKKVFQLKSIITVLFILAGIVIFSFYLKYIFYPECWKIGYTLCAALGEDYFALYQSGYNFYHNYFIYGGDGSLAAQHLVTPYFMVFKYFPATALIWGWPFIFFSAEEAYRILYLFSSVILHISALSLLYLIFKKLKLAKINLALAIFVWLSFFPLASEWRMGQYNDLAGIFFLAFLAAEIYGKKTQAAIMWILSLAWKPLTLFSLPYFFRRINKIAVGLFFVFFILLTGGYLIVFSNVFGYEFVFQKFFGTLLIGSGREPLQIHYIDNFGMFSFLGELFYDLSPIVYLWITKLYLLAILIIYGVISWKVKLADIYDRLNYLLFTATTIMMFHREIWESLLTFWLPILAVLILTAKNRKELIFVSIMAIFLGTPSLFYFWQQNHSDFWRFLLIGEKALPQLALYVYILKKIPLQKTLKDNKLKV
jgi:hypothetical protein